MTLQKRYQVFVSSTFADLQVERQEVIQALLELQCIPAGMELFPAANEDQWSLIKRVIDDCDYYIVVTAGRYGSLGESGVGYTEMEYRYAVERGKPVLAFLHKDPGAIAANKCEQDPVMRERLEVFRAGLKKKLVKFWSNPAELGSMVSRSMVHLINSTPAIGWIKADRVPEESASQEILRLRNRIDELEAELQTVRVSAPAGTDRLAKGDDSFDVKFRISARSVDSVLASEKLWSGHYSPTWNELFFELSPLMVLEATEDQLKDKLTDVVKNYADTRFRARTPGMAGYRIVKVMVDDSDFQTIKIQFRALGLISKSVRSRSVKDQNAYWTLTPYGDDLMTRLRAIVH